jgi:hypothetical protein
MSVRFLNANILDVTAVTGSDHNRGEWGQPVDKGQI